MMPKLFQYAALVCVGALVAAPSYAGLGDPVNSDAVLLHNAEAVQIKAQETSSTMQPQLSVYQLKSQPGTVIKEYTLNDKVVAVTWEGPTLPNLRELMGEQYFTTFANRPKSQNHIDRHNAKLNTDDLIVESHGQMRHFAGRAYLPKLLPANFDLTQIN